MKYPWVVDVDGVDEMKQYKLYAKATICGRCVNCLNIARPHCPVSAVIAVINGSAVLSVCNAKYPLLKPYNVNVYMEASKPMKDIAWLYIGFGGGLVGSDVFINPLKIGIVWRLKWWSPELSR